MVGKLFSSLQCLTSDVVHSFFRFCGTNAYCFYMTTDVNMDLTVYYVGTANFWIVRTWAFNDVLCNPSSGPYFQVILCKFLFHFLFIPLINPEWRSGHYHRRS